MLKRLKRLSITAVLAAAVALPAASVHAELAWNQAAWYRNGLSASEMLDKPVRGENGERIGEVKDIIIDRAGQIRTIVVEVGGFFEIGDQHIGVPWRHVSVGRDMQFIQVPLREARGATYSLFGRVPRGEDVPIALTSWRVNELIGDYASLSDVPRYGIVSDVIFDATGKAKAVVVRRSPAWGGHGLYAFPFTGHFPAAFAYPLPYRNETLATLEPFDYRELGRQSLYAGTDGAAAGKSLPAPSPAGTPARGLSDSQALRAQHASMELVRKDVIRLLRRVEWPDGAPRVRARRRRAGRRGDSSTSSSPPGRGTAASPRPG